jgi:hypothetical protein
VRSVGSPQYLGSNGIEAAGAEIFQECWGSAHRWLTSISATIPPGTSPGHFEKPAGITDLEITPPPPSTFRHAAGLFVSPDLTTCSR